MNKKLQDANWYRFAGVLSFVGASLMLISSLRDPGLAKLVSSFFLYLAWFSMVSTANQFEKEAKAEA